MCVWKNDDNITLLIEVLYKYLNKTIGREEATLHAFFSSLKTKKSPETQY